MNKTVAMLAAIAVMLVCQANSMGTIEEKEIASPRKLGFDFNVEKTFDIKTFSVAGQKVIMKYRVAVLNGTAINQIIIQTNQGVFRFGNDGVDSETSKSWSINKKILNFRFPPVSVITLGLYVSGTLQCTVKYATDSKDSLQMTLTGDLKAGVKVINGPGSLYKIYTGAEGTLISTSGYATVTKNDVIKGFKFSGTEVNTWVEVKAFWKKLWRKTYKITEAW